MGRFRHLTCYHDKTWQCNILSITWHPWSIHWVPWKSLETVSNPCITEEGERGGLLQCDHTCAGPTRADYTFSIVSTARESHNAKDFNKHKNYDSKRGNKSKVLLKWEIEKYAQDKLRAKNTYEVPYYSSAQILLFVTVEKAKGEAHVYYLIKSPSLFHNWYFCYLEKDLCSSSNGRAKFF
jgi:hypothetical protein